MAEGALLSLLKATSVFVARAPGCLQGPACCTMIPKQLPAGPSSQPAVFLGYGQLHAVLPIHSPFMLKLVADASVTSSNDKRRLIHRIKIIH